MLAVGEWSDEEELCFSSEVELIGDDGSPLTGKRKVEIDFGFFRRSVAAICRELITLPKRVIKAMNPRGIPGCTLRQNLNEVNDWVRAVLHSLALLCPSSLSHRPLPNSSPAFHRCWGSKARSKCEQGKGVHLRRRRTSEEQQQQQQQQMVAGGVSHRGGGVEKVERDGEDEWMGLVVGGGPNAVGWWRSSRRLLSSSLLSEKCTITAALAKRCPKYAIVRLSEGTDVLRLYKLLLENGYPEVSFVNEVRENGFLPYSMQHQTQQEPPQNNDRSNALVSGDKMNSLLAPMADERKAPFDACHRLQYQPPSLLQQHQPPHSSSSGPPRARPTSAKAPLGRASSSAASHPQHPPPSQTRVYINGNGGGIVEDGHAGGLLPALSATSPASSSSSTAANGGVTAAMSMPASAPVTGKKNDEFAVCLLCNNRIMSSRLSNLTNHVRRHASLKQYRCCHCHYSHNEMAKVRLHMAHNHQDFSSQPMDMLSFEMQLQWGLLMEQCFPEHSKRFGPSAANSQFRNLEELQKYVDMERSYTCIECGEVLTGYQLVTHLEDVHRQECVPYACGQCGYQSSSQWKVRLHISVKHSERAAETTVATLPAGSNFMLFLQKFFAEVHIPVEEDEVKLVAELQEKNSGRLLAAMNALAGDHSVEDGHDDEDDDGLSAVEKEANGGELLLSSSMPPASPLNLTGEGSIDTDGELLGNEVEEERRESAKMKLQEDGARRASALLEEEGDEVVYPRNEKLNFGKKVSSVRKRDNSLMMMEENEEGLAEQPTMKRHSLRQSNRLMLVAEKRNVPFGSSGKAIPTTLETPILMHLIR
uniref:C2H2-type domain-containing protein n=1 Tax=Globodera rostochiensis TaxID=31243 RepID=A0A914HGP0_GLORO